MTTVTIEPTRDGTERPTVPNRTVQRRWIPVDSFIRRYEALRDPGGKYGTLGLRNSDHWAGTR